jgi:CHAT domain-containing protein
MAEGYGKGQALRMAQLQILQQEGERHPYRWAPFSLVGDTGPL